VYVGAVQVGVIHSNQNGTIILPTSWFPNGQQQIWVEVVNQGVPVDTDGDSVADDVSSFQAWANITVNFANDVYMQNYSPLYSKAGSIALQYTATSSQDYTFEVFKTNGTLLHTASEQSVNGSITRQWNYTDFSGTAVNERVYVFALTYTPHSGGQGAAAAVAKKIITTNFVDSGVSVRKYVVSYGETPSSSLNTALSDVNRFLSIRVNGAAYFNYDIVGSDREDYNPPYIDFSSDPFSIRKATQTNDLLALTNALKSVETGSWLFEGHSGQTDMIPGTDLYLTVRLYARDVATLLGNSYGFNVGTFSVTYGRRLFSTFITGCSAAVGTSEWPNATGTPLGVQQVGNSQLKKSAFLGFTGLSYVPAKYPWINRIHFEWLDGSDYDTALSTAVSRANLAYPAVQSWGPTVLGYTPLEYNGDESH